MKHSKKEFNKIAYFEETKIGLKNQIKTRSKINFYTSQ